MELAADTSPCQRMIIGDSNATLFDHERRGPRRFCSGAASEFSAMVNASTMIQIPSFGRKFTWSNNQRRGHVTAVLDRTLVNEEWLKTFDDCIQKELPRIASDHAPLMVCSGSSLRPRNCPFRINNFWLDHLDFLDLVNAAWSFEVSSSPTSILAQKLKGLKPIIKAWSCGAFPNLDQEVATSKSELDAIQSRIEIEGCFEHLFDLEADAKTRYWKAIENHEKLWSQKSRIRWLKEGDRCSRFFHVMTRVKRARNSIRSIVIDNGDEISDLDQLGSYLENFYKNFHKSIELENHPQIFNCIPNILLDSDRLMLDASPLDAEIKEAVWDLDPDNSPGPDGYTGSFFRKCWVIINNDVCRAEQGAFQKGKVIQMNISLASELKNLMESSSRGGGLGLKIDIRKAFDTISWDFFHVLRKFGFSEIMIGRMHTILKTARISILHNGGPVDFFETCRGLRQGGPISPLLFIIAEEVLCHGMADLSTKGLIKPLAGPRGAEVPTHLLFADDVFIFMNTSKSFSVYWWPATFNQMLEKWMRNFIWMGEIDSTKKTTVKWDSICKPKKEGGLGIRRLRDVNKALLAKLTWKIKNEESQLSRLIGSGRSVDFWNDNWLGPTSIQNLSILDEEELSNISHPVALFIENGRWALPLEAKPIADFLAKDAAKSGITSENVSLPPRIR
ncbi:uncharacterized protein LOC122092221 [Macadamia integrifolia]|uniref:uncharacterized protein LOC122092221 n=1 Tax=Macadamia integrifolia TaxID=60698 RepID=UPI001C4EF876|nr:uncharacterized protein LOC122092221 [Macadamia integrifolia]